MNSCEPIFAFGRNLDKLYSGRDRVSLPNTLVKVPKYPKYSVLSMQPIDKIPPFLQINPQCKLSCRVNLTNVNFSKYTYNYCYNDHLTVMRLTLQTYDVVH